MTYELSDLIINRIDTLIKKTNLTNTELRNINMCLSDILHQLKMFNSNISHQEVQNDA